MNAYTETDRLRFVAKILNLVKKGAKPDEVELKACEYYLEDLIETANVRKANAEARGELWKLTTQSQKGGTYERRPNKHAMPSFCIDSKNTYGRPMGLNYLPWFLR